MSSGYPLTHEACSPAVADEGGRSTRGRDLSHDRRPHVAFETSWTTGRKGTNGLSLVHPQPVRCWASRDTAEPGHNSLARSSRRRKPSSGMAGRRAARRRLGAARYVHGRRRARRADHELRAADPRSGRATGRRRWRRPRWRRSTTSRAAGSGSTSCRASTTPPPMVTAAFDKAGRYERTREFMQILRRLWTEDTSTTRAGTTGSRAPPCGPSRRAIPDARTRPSTSAARLGRGGAGRGGGGRRTALLGEPLADIAERIARLKRLSVEVGRQHAPLRFGLRITTLVRETSEETWRDAEARSPGWPRREAPAGTITRARSPSDSSGFSISRRAATSSMPTSTPHRADMAAAGPAPRGSSARPPRSPLRSKRYRDLGVTDLILSDTPYLREIERQGQTLPAAPARLASSSIAVKRGAASRRSGL